MRKGKYVSRRKDGAEVRDARSVRPADEKGRRKPAKKDTKRWCKGVEGREHKPSWQPRNAAWAASQWRDFKCDACGKVLDTWWPFGKGHGMPPEIGSREPRAAKGGA